MFAIFTAHDVRPYDTDTRDGILSRVDVTPADLDAAIAAAGWCAAWIDVEPVIVTPFPVDADVNSNWPAIAAHLNQTR